MPRSDKLKGLNVVAFESRLAGALKDLFALQGAEVFSAPAMQEVPLGENPAALAFADRLLGGGIDVLVLLTGVGTRALLEAMETRHRREDLLSALGRIPIVPRGPKPVRVLNELKLPYAFTVPEPNTWQDLLAALDAHRVRVPLEGRTVAVQEYGVPNHELADALRARGARVIRVPVYRWSLPDDTGPLEEAVRRLAARRADVAVFTTAVQATHLLEVASRLGSKDLLLESLARTVVASVGPDCSQALRGAGVRVDIEPESPKMGPLVEAVAERARPVLESLRSGGGTVR